MQQEHTSLLALPVQLKGKTGEISSHMARLKEKVFLHITVATCSRNCILTHAVCPPGHMPLKHTGSKTHCPQLHVWLSKESADTTALFLPPRATPKGHTNFPALSLNRDSSHSHTHRPLLNHFIISHANVLAPTLRCVQLRQHQPAPRPSRELNPEFSWKWPRHPGAAGKEGLAFRIPFHGRVN